MRYRVLTLIALVALAGCGSLAGGLTDSGPTVSDAHIEIQEGSPILAFNYTVSDYSDALLKGPSGQVISRGTLEPNATESGFYLTEPRGGNYTIIIQQGGSTEATLTTEFEGPNVVAEDTSATWNGQSVTDATLTVSNTGDLPAKVQSWRFRAAGGTNDGYLNRWLSAGETTEMTFSSGFSSMTVTEPGTARGVVTLNTTAGVVSGAFSRTFDGPSLNITYVSPRWNGGELSDVTVIVENTGDLPAETAVEVRNNGERLEQTEKKTIQPGVTPRYRIDPRGDDVIYSATSGGETTLTVAARSQSETVTQEITNEVSAASVDVTAGAIWESGQLQAITADLSNSGDVPASFTIEYVVNGEVVYSGQIDELAGNADAKYQYGDTGFGADPIYTTDGGQEKVTVRLTGGASASDTVTESFAGPSATVSNVDPGFIDTYDEPTYELNTLRMTVQNTGDTTLAYDTIEYEISGYTDQENAFSAEVTPGETKTEFLSGDISVSGGSHTITFRFINAAGEVVATETATVTAE